MVFREDDSRIRKGHGPENFAVLRHIALNLIGREKSTKGSFKAKRYRAALSDQYRSKCSPANIFMRDCPVVAPFSP